MRRICLFLSFLLSVQFVAAANEANSSHLKGIYSLYMTVDTSMATDIQLSERLDLNDIMELQLRRGDVDLNTYVLNQPEVNIPLVELSIDTSSRIASGEFELVVKVRDFVTIDRNGEKTVATVFEMRRRGSSSSGSKQVEVIKKELRDMMGDFVTTFREVNPKK
ncbi:MULTISPECIES: hypothetical protein [unclassified Lentimonas]|uniref:hypothetical protein n=1 Tax=unclassified Lentimonas TaxID=2630993 RepID=UPI00132BE964|nr:MULTISPECIES: hypothetical protein [unclassified Lentimonas]CAA6679573.1 Unannotated [Lentimonas sp. CC4]CAA6687291.1 Unannotated [Lentimonas sp. CC6]CAA7077186.1 Unannotated [Lentimonas sp. CC4]CAA7171795.1 Unannotated [Lentimonas sp. CC21]CAA7183440.1 Unannotated [Lentimonas sp. CC8]